MSAAAVLVGLLVGAGVFMLLQRAQLRLIIGFILLGHAVNVLLLSAGGLRWRAPAFADGGPDRADPLPQAFALTAIVISFGITIYLLGLLRRGGSESSALERDPPDEEDVAHRPTEASDQDEV
ncbi:MAG: sodium:proton antiporter [Micromonospora sp.]